MNTGHHADSDTTDEAGHDQGHGDEFYALTNPRYFGLPLGVLLAATVSGAAVFITLFKFFGLSLLGH